MLLGGERRRSLAIAAVVPLALLALVAGSASAAPPTTEQQTLTGDVAAPWSFLTIGPGWPRVVRTDLGPALAGREARRRSLEYFAQMSDFQLADEESPARVEALDIDGSPLVGAWRPQEAFGPFVIDRAIQQINAFRTESPVAQGTGPAPQMDFTILTGDNADNNQRNEVRWVQQLLDGQSIDPNSGVPTASCPSGTIPPGEDKRYTGVQDYSDAGRNVDFYDPNDPAGRYAAWPRYPGVMDRAQAPFTATGFGSMPSYVALGNHDGLVQGNVPANGLFEAVGTGCNKVVSPLPLNQLSPDTIQGLIGAMPRVVVPVPADPDRQFVDMKQYKALFNTGSSGHGFGLVDPLEYARSNGAASYYSYSPRPGLRMIALDTVSTAGYADGNIDDPQWQWLIKQLDAAHRRKELVILYGHHPIRTLIVPAPDELAPPCTTNDAHGHDQNPGCDRDPRFSMPIHRGEDLQQLLLSHPEVIAYVAGHTHEHKITPFKRNDPFAPGGFWGIETASEVDWPVQSRLLNVMDNRDGTLSIFGTLIDHAGPVGAPPTSTSTFNDDQLAAIGRTISFNEYQHGGAAGIGTSQDRNVELMVPNPMCFPPTPMEIALAKAEKNKAKAQKKKQDARDDARDRKAPAAGCKAR